MQSCRVLVDDQDLCGEGPLWDAQTSRLYWIDITGQRMSCLEWPSETKHTLACPVDVAGLALNDPTGFVLVSSNGIWLWQADAVRTAVLLSSESLPLRMNDCIADPRGRLLSGTCHFDPARSEYPLGKLLSVDRNGDVSILDEGFALANGLGFSPDNRTLYFTDSARREIYAYDYKEETSEVRNRRSFVRVPDSEGLPDGLTVDAEGYVWSAQWFGGCLCRYDPDGKIERRFPVPALQTSSLTFGGPDLTDVFITSAARSNALRLAPAGYDPHSSNVGGQLFHVNLGIQGKEEFHCRIQAPYPARASNAQ
jgi:D-xylonolactonase